MTTKYYQLQKVFETISKDSFYIAFFLEYIETLSQASGLLLSL